MKNTRSRTGWPIFSAVVLLKLFFLISITCFITACKKEVTAVPAARHGSIIAYVAGWHEIIKPDSIPVYKLTHINYAFALIGDGEIVTGHPNDKENLGILSGLKEKNEKLKIIISVGGWEGSGGFSDMALNKTNRTKFIESVISFLGKYNLDGIDLDWEYPGLPGFGGRLLQRGLQSRA
jgi:chitinase